MKSFRAKITEYDLELPKVFEALKRQLLGLQSPQSSNNESAVDNNLDIPPLPLVNSGEKENEPYVPPLNMEKVTRRGMREMSLPMAMRRIILI